MDDAETIGRQRMKEFYDLSHVMFTKPERLILYKILKDYKKRQDVTRLVMGLNLVLRTYTKLELLKYIRYFVWEGHLHQFDKQTRFHRRFRRRLDPDDKYNTFPADAKSMASTSTNLSGRQVKDVRVFTIHRDRGEPNLGFSVRGGSEHGISIYVSDVETDSAADKCGLQMGDKILEVNNISLRGVASSTAVKVLTGSKRLKLVVQRSRKVPEWRLSREKTAWYDVQEKTIISGDFEECGISNHIRGLDVDVPERRVNLKFGKANRGLGFNIRGGREYGLGIYVSKVDQGGLAESNGVRVGDQVIDVNGVPFDNITHANAVEVLQGKRHLILTLRDVGRFPVFKELYAEYTWSDSLLKAGGSRSLTDIHLIQEEPTKRSGSVADLFSSSKLPSSLHSEIFLPANTGQHHANIEHNSEDDKLDADNDSDSLIDLDQWAHDIQKPSEYNNYGYDSEDEPGTSAVVHIYDTSQECSETKKIKGQSSDVSFETNNENTDYFGQIESEYDTPDMLYAKINKTNAVYESSTNLSVNDTGEHNDNNSDNESATFSIHQRSNSDKSFKVTENRQTFATDNTSTHTIDGALYSTVRRLSGGSYKQLKNTDLGIYGSTVSFGHEYNDHSSRESLNSDIHNDVTLKRQGRSKSYTVTPIDGDRSTKSGLPVDTVLPYQIEDVKKRGDKDMNDENDDTIGTVVVVDNDDVDMDTVEDRLKELQKRQESIGLQELNALDALAPPGEPLSEGSVRKKGKWSSLKNKIKGSLRLKSPKRAALVTKQSDDYLQSGTSKSKLWKINKSGRIDSANMASLEEAAKAMLDDDEFSGVLRHIKTYHETRQLETLVEVLLVILDKPEKVMLLKDIRGVIYSYDLVKYDNMVNEYEIEAYQKLSLKLHLPLNHKLQKKPRRNLMTAEIDDQVEKSTQEREEAEGGHFHIRQMQHSNKQRDVIDAIKGSVDDTKTRYDSGNRHTSGDGISVLDHFEYLDLERVDEMTSLAAFSDYSHSSNEMERVPGSVIVHLSKNKTNIGIDLAEEVVGGNKEVRITGIDPHGAANDDSMIEVGMILLGVDRHKVDGLSVDEVWAILDQSYMDKRHVSMKLVLIKQESTNF